ncbi:MAG TPA: hypothetical protein PKA90_09900 [Ignavibacteria bacterium]|nr:hypothetical protein [Ignavibacteria bacterium]HMR40728.1 hypothetical protein [Ignavibacteria bacterium]
MNILIMKFLAFLFACSYGFIGEYNFHNDSDKTEIVVIGTVHENTPNFNADTLLEIINRFKPDVILLESDSTYFNSDFTLEEEIEYMFPETAAITEYSKNNPVILRPYDISGRDDFLNDQSRLTGQSGFFNEIDLLSDSGIYNEKGFEIYSKINMMKEIAEEMSYSTLTFINSEDGSKNIDTINYYTYEGLKVLIEVTPELSQYASYWKNEYEFWIKRNNAMVINILELSRKYEGKKILVMCGFAHKNILLTGLKLRSEEYNIEVGSLNDI